MSGFIDYLDEKADIMRDLIQRLTANPHFQKDIDRIRTELGIDPKSKDLEWTAELTILIAPHIGYLRREYDLDWRWASFLGTYIFSGKVDNISAGPLTRYIMDEATRKYIPHIAVFAETREKDVIIAYREIDRFYRNEERTAGYIGRRTDRYDNIDRDKQWYEWRYQEDMSLRNIAKKWALETGEPQPHHMTVKRGIEKFEQTIKQKEI